MKVSTIKEVIKELITETEKMFGKKIKIQVQGNLYPALISRNTRHSHTGEKPYRITWFNPKYDAKQGMKMAPKNHMDFNFEELEYILKNEKLPKRIIDDFIDCGIEIPQLIFEMKQPMKTASYILVGTITPDDDIIAKYGGSHAIHGMRGEYNWRYNPYTERVYWHNPHPPMYETWVKSYIEGKGHTVSWQITLSNIDDKDTYDNLWSDAHGLD